MVGLTAKQKEELNNAVLEYLVKNDFKQSALKFASEANLKMPEDNAKQSDFKNDILEKKWTSVVRLKKQVMELEKITKQLKEETICQKCEAMNEIGAAMGLSKVQGDGLPREPEKFIL